MIRKFIKGIIKEIYAEESIELKKDIRDELEMINYQDTLDLIHSKFKDFTNNEKWIDELIERINRKQLK